MASKRFLQFFAATWMCVWGPALSAQTPESVPAQVKIVQTDRGYTLTVNGAPFFINGAGGTRYMDKLVAAGGNSVRTWGSSQRDLDQAQEHGLKVCMGLPARAIRHGADYGDPGFVTEQRRRILAEVEKLKDHPALLMWGIGNEVEHEADREKRLLAWREIEEIARAIKQIDANHPVITVLAGTGDKLTEIKQMCPSLDAVGINSYGGLLKLPQDLRKYGWDKPYLVTEFGPRGWWETDKTSWGLPIEDSSTEKAAFYARAYKAGIAGQPNCLGSYVFLWGQKQEKTHTWFGLFLPDGRATEIVETMTRVWTGKWPDNRCPRIGKKEIFSRSTDHIYAPASEIEFVIDASDPENDAITVQWDLRKDVSDNPATGGDFEPPADPIEGAIIKAEGSKAIIRMPSEKGNYRLFAYVSDTPDRAATANLPVKVE